MGRAVYERSAVQTGVVVLLFTRRTSTHSELEVAHRVGAVRVDRILLVYHIPHNVEKIVDDGAWAFGALVGEIATGNPAEGPGITRNHLEFLREEVHQSRRENVGDYLRRAGGGHKRIGIRVAIAGKRNQL